MLNAVQNARFNSSRVTKAGTTQCLEGTRAEVLEKIVTWFTNDSPETPSVFWLNGMAGHGKSTIAKCIAHKVFAAKRLGASFFGSRHAEIRLRDPAAVIPTVAYQLAEFGNDYLMAIAEATDKHRHVTDLDVNEQVRILLRDPLISIEDSVVTPLVIFDAWDELAGPEARELLLTLLSSLSADSALPLKVLFTSRLEPYIRAAFQEFENSTQLFLHNTEDTIVKQDIELYLETRLRQVPKELNIPLPEDWFSSGDFAALARSSGNLFVYAAPVARLISSKPPANPRAQLAKILTKTGRLFSALSYLEILSAVAGGDLDFLQDFRTLIGCMIILRDSVAVSTLEKLLGLDESQAYSILITIFSLVIFPVHPSGTLQFYHPSVPDFFVDLTRCSDARLYIDSPVHEINLTRRCLKTIRDSTAANASPGVIEAGLVYSCTYWASHLSKAPLGNHDLIQSLNSFLHTDFLQWLEIMSAKDLVPKATRALLDAEIWVVCIDLFGYAIIG